MGPSDLDATPARACVARLAVCMLVLALAGCSKSADRPAAKGDGLEQTTLRHQGSAGAAGSPSWPKISDTSRR